LTLNVDFHFAGQTLYSEQANKV